MPTKKNSRTEMISAAKQSNYSMAKGSRIADRINNDNDESSGLTKTSIVCIVVIAIVLTFIHAHHLATMFENDRHFSHLADIEREMTYRTEMGLYYSYYKCLIEAPTFIDGMRQIVYDNVTEYGHTINTLKRFNLYPEVVLAAYYRLFKYIVDWKQWKVQTCWQVNRGGGLPPIESCEGIGNAHYFYVDHVFAFAGTVVTTLFLIGVLLSDSIVGGIITAAAFFFNHGEATRVQWTPPLRESFGYPICVAQILLVSIIIKYRKVGFLWSSIVAALTLSFMLVWQFAQFVLTTQLASLFITFVFDYLSPKTFRTIIVGYLMSLLCAFVLLFGNEMLLTSLFLSGTITALLIVLIDNILNRISFRPLFILIECFLFAVGTIGIKISIGRLISVDDDAHIFELLRAKFTNFANFHTRLYTCAVEFDFLGYEAPTKLSQTLLIPSAIVASLLIVIYFARNEYSSIMWRSNDNRIGKPYTELLYNVIQLGCFTIMAVLIMRLKLFWTPHLCVIASVLGNYKLIKYCIGQYYRLSSIQHTAVLIALLAAMSYQGYSNLQQQKSIIGEYSNPDQEMLFDWILRETKTNSVFAGTMPVMANVKLSTKRPIVNHPHYEDAGLRARTLKVYAVYSKKSLKEVHKMLMDMGVNYFIFQYGWCAESVNEQCSYRAMWDMVDPANRGNPLLCDLISIATIGSNSIRPFEVVYDNRGYKVLKIQ